jgi:DNA-directed RNA polymerase sigma subunit (sigma70/sigma32)
VKVPGLEYREITNKPTNKTHDFIPGNNVSDPLKRLEDRERSIYRQRNGMHDGERLTMAAVNEKRRQGTLFS